MKTRTLISNLILAASMTVGAAHAGSITTDELFDSITSGDSNSIYPTDRVELSKMEFSDVKPSEDMNHQRSIDELFDYITTD